MKYMLKFAAGFLLMFSLFMAVPQPVSAQCPMCKAAVVANSGYGEEPNAMASGLNAGIFYLFALPYLSILGVGGLFYLGYRKLKRADAEAEALAAAGETPENNGHAPGDH